MRREVFAILASVIAAIIFSGLNLTAWKWLAPIRIDFTANGLFTLSSSAKRVVVRLVEPVDLELVYSRARGADFPAIRAHADRVREMLHAIAARSGGKVRLRETDPAPFSDAEDRITAAGLKPAPTDRGDPIYFGVIGRNSVDDVIAIPFLQPERDALLEYDLVRLIAQLDDPSPPKVAVISSLAAFRGDGAGEGDASVLREMRRSFEVIPVDPNFRALPMGADVLMMVHPPALDDWQQYVLDQFLLRKGRALIALDPVSRASLTSRDPHAIAVSGLGRLSDTLGVSIGPEAVADRALALPIQVEAGGGRTTIEGQPLFPAPPHALMSAADLITADLSRAINFGVPGHLVVKLAPGAKFTTLIETTPQAGLIPAELAMSDPTPRMVIAALKPTAGAQVLAGRLSGELKSAFERPPPTPKQDDPALARLEAEEMARLEPYVSRSQTPAEIVLVADADAFDDSFYINPNSNAPIADNAAFILNALDNLGGDEALMALRSRAPAWRPMERVDELRAAARDRLYNKQQQLESLLSEAEARLKALEAGRVKGAVRTSEDLAEIGRFREEANGLRRQLRGVEGEFRRDIDALAGLLELINVWLPPLLAGLIGAGVFFWRNRRSAA